ncbi:MAG TPA: PRC-barrel domain-containing protein [Sphingobium sp.]|nr:PRC-barrel domain-containing protein [Sphingobium sp.]
MADRLVTEESNRLISSEKVDGTAVYSRDGERLGSVKSFMVDKRSGKAEYAVLQFGGLFGIGSDYYPIPWDMLAYDVDQGGYVVDIDKEKLEKAPRYASGDLEGHDDRYSREVHGYWGFNAPFI